MDKIRRLLRKVKISFKDQQAKGAQKTMLEELFNDFYTNRKQIYKINFLRGIFFGLGSALGGTLVIALIIWIISLFTNFPIVGQYFEQTKDSLNTTKSE